MIFFCFHVNTGSFSFFEGYPISQFLEYPLLLIQTVIILLLFGHISNRFSNLITLYVHYIIYVGIHLQILSEIYLFTIYLGKIYPVNHK